MTNKHAIVIMSDPKNGADEALGRVLNGLLLAKSLKDKNNNVSIFFQGTGTRWPAVLKDEKHPGNKLYNSITGLIAGASEACAKVFGADTTDMKLLSECSIPGVEPKATDLAKYITDGYTIHTF